MFCRMCMRIVVLTFQVFSLFPVSPQLTNDSPGIWDSICIPITNFFRGNLVIFLMSKLKEILHFMCKTTRQVVDRSLGKLNFLLLLFIEAKNAKVTQNFIQRYYHVSLTQIIQISVLRLFHGNAMKHESNWLATSI